MKNSRSFLFCLCVIALMSFRTAPEPAMSQPYTLVIGGYYQDVSGDDIIARDITYRDLSTITSITLYMTDSMNWLRGRLPVIHAGRGIIKVGTEPSDTLYTDTSLVITTTRFIDSILALRGSIPTNVSSLTNDVPYLITVPAQSFSSLIGKPSTLGGYGIVDGYPLSGNPSGFISSVPAQSYSSLTGKPTTLSGYGITDPIVLSSGTYSNPSWITGITWSKISSTPTSFSGYNISETTTDLPEGTNQYYTNTRARAALSLTTTGAGIPTYTGGVLNIPTPTTYIPSINSVTRLINSSTFTPSSTLQATLIYNVSISCTASIGSASTGTVNLQYSTNGGSTWATVSTLSNSNTVTLALTLNAITVQSAALMAVIPVNALCRLVPTTAGTTTITYISGQEIY